MFPSKEKNLITCVYLFKLMPLNIYIFFFLQLRHTSFCVLSLSVFAEKWTNLEHDQSEWTLRRQHAGRRYVCVCLCLCVLSVSGVYLQCVALGVPVVSGVSSCNVCLGLCLGFCTVSSAVAGGKLVCVCADSFLQMSCKIYLILK